MIVDEKKILKNLDQYLIRNNPEERASTSNGAIEQIEIGEPEQVDGVDHGADAAKLFKLPVTLKVLFSNKDDLISFVDNIEKFIIPQEEDRILYEINEVAYDMMQYDQAQTTELQLTAYYFN